MGLTASSWDDCSIVSNEYIAYGKLACSNWLMSSLHHIGAIVHVHTDLDIDVALTINPDTDLLGDFSSTNADVEPFRVPKKIYLLAPFVGIFLERVSHTLAEAWTSLRGAIVKGVHEVDCRPIIDWLHIALTKKVNGDKFPLAMPQPTAPLADGELLWHQHHMLTHHLHGMEPTVQWVQGSLITMHIGDVAV